jgi:4-hydroxy-tetrahydrodipicolinate reductase
MATARQMVKAKGNKFNLPPSLKENIKGGRGAELGGIAIHSVRSPGYMANQEVIFGGQGQTLKIRHDQISREAFMPGVVMAVKEIVKRKGLTFGLENLLGLQVEGSTQS